MDALFAPFALGTDKPVKLQWTRETIWAPQSIAQWRISNSKAGWTLVGPAIASALLQAGAAPVRSLAIGDKVDKLS